MYVVNYGIQQLAYFVVGRILLCIIAIGISHTRSHASSLVESHVETFISSINCELSYRPIPVIYEISFLSVNPNLHSRNNVLSIRLLRFLSIISYWHRDQWWSLDTQIFVLESKFSSYGKVCAFFLTIPWEVKRRYFYFT